MDVNPPAAAAAAASVHDLVVISAGGFGRSLVNTCHGDPDNGVVWRVTGYLDNRPALAAKAGLPILGDPMTYQARDGQSFMCALGDPGQRRRFAAPLLAQGATFMNLCTGLFPADGLRMGVGCFFEPPVRIGVDVTLGDFVVIQSTSVIGYEVVIGSYVTVGAFVFIGGGAQIGEDVVIHPHATILPKVSIGAGAVVGAGSVVMADVPPGVTVLGNPAKIFRFK
ncbi:acetyltransferase [Massilia sp. PWRC2]|uniref:PglD-related sugar-binding protein n=1 Tax=Massilia sp. PWRC2 TaxID=2804626 RepID=UPI003CEDB5EB